MKEKTGLLLVVEAQDGAGKSTQVARLRGLLESKGFDVVLTREPGGTPLAESVRGLVLSSPMDMLTEMLLVFAARRDHVQQVIRPALARGAVVLCDRFVDSTYAYQGWGRGCELARIRQMEQMVLDGLRADLTVYYSLSAEVAARRRSGARVADRFEAESISFFERVSQGYEARIAERRDAYLTIDAGPDEETVWNATVEGVRRMLPSLGL